MQASPRTSPLTNNALLVVRRDLSRQYAELIDVPIANEHLDRRYLIVGISRTVAPPLRPQTFDFEINHRHVSIVSHDPSPSQCRSLSSAPKMAVGGNLLAGSGSLIGFLSVSFETKNPRFSVAAVAQRYELADGAAAIIRCSRAASSASDISLSRFVIASAERWRSRDCGWRTRSEPLAGHNRGLEAPSGQYSASNPCECFS
jgi:hypothetical protein